MIIKHQWLQCKYTLAKTLMGVLLKIKQEHYLIASIYNAHGMILERRPLINKILQILDDIPDNMNIIIGGDWNSVPDPSMDRCTITNTQTTYPTTTLPDKEILHVLLQMRTHNLIDIYDLESTEPRTN